MRKIPILLLATVAFGAIAASAYAYPNPNVPSQAGKDCIECHGSVESSASPTATGAKGPHGGYTAGTDKCSTCHSVHSAGSARALLPHATIIATCNTCHDGTGGRGVYGAIAHRMPGVTPAGHSMGGATNGKVAVPGGSASGGAAQVAFTGENGGLTCTDCHSAHDSGTVEPFIGDRARSATPGAPIKSNRLLRARPTSSETTVTVYGTDWCVTCHKGAEKGSMNHPVASKDSTVPADYSHVRGLVSYDATGFVGADSLISLGGSNLGYVMPTGLDDGTAPICQQCHEDSRSIANDPDNPQSVRSATESFSAPFSGGEGDAVAGNPTFQNFPHETVNPSMLVETQDSLCTNCHNR